MTHVKGRTRLEFDLKAQANTIVSLIDGLGIILDHLGE